MFVEWMQMLPDGHVTDHLPRTKALKVLGNGVVPAQAALALRKLFDRRGDLGVQRESVGVVGVGLSERFGAEPHEAQLALGQFQGDRHAPHRAYSTTEVKGASSTPAESPLGPTTNERKDEHDE